MKNAEIVIAELQKRLDSAKFEAEWHLKKLRELKQLIFSLSESLEEIKMITKEKKDIINE